MVFRMIETVVPKAQLKERVQSLRKAGWETIHPIEPVKLRNPLDPYGYRRPANYSPQGENVILVMFKEATQ